jgi:hypothetical protein
LLLLLMLRKDVCNTYDIGRSAPSSHHEDFFGRSFFFAPWRKKE